MGASRVGGGFYRITPRCPVSADHAPRASRAKPDSEQFRPTPRTVGCLAGTLGFVDRPRAPKERDYDAHPCATPPTLGNSRYRIPAKYSGWWDCSR
jgi:hypothetical protein